MKSLEQQFAELLSTIPQVAEQQGLTPLEVTEQWVKSQPAERRRVAKQLLHSWALEDQLPEQRPSSEQVNEAWARLREQLRHASTDEYRGVNASASRHKYIRWSLALAVAIAFVALAYVLGYTLGSKELQFLRIHHHSPIPREITLADGTKVWVGRGAVFEYPTSFSATHRRVELIKGQAYFDVQKDPERPFSVSTPRFIVYVEGTAFNIHSAPSQSVLSVQEGHLRVESRGLRFRALYLSTLQQLTLTDTTRYTHSLQDENYLAWKTGVLSFRDTPLLQLLDVLSSYYEAPIKAPKLHSRCALTVTFNHLSLEEALSIIDQLTEGTHERTPEQGYRLSPRRCP